VEIGPAAQADPSPAPAAEPPPAAAATGCDALRAEIRSERFHCLPTPGHGFWAVSVGEDDAATVVHADADGTQTSVVIPREPEAMASTKGEGDAQVFDFDGDGVPELFFTLVMQGLEDRIVRRAFLTVRGGQIVPYAPAQHLRIDALRDVDGDGRPDAIVAVDLGFFKGCDWCSGDDLTETFSAHALGDGNFSFTDEVSKRYVRQRCPTKPRPPFVRGGEIRPEEIACARIWGTPRATLLARLRAECAPHPDDAALCQGPCRYLEWAELMATLQPPTRLE
jgi:hypothetical protein